MSLEDCALGTSVVVTDSHCAIAGDGSDQSAKRIDRHISDWSFMADELVGPCVWAETPCEDKSIVRLGNDLLETGVENGLGDFVFVALESLEQSGVCSPRVDSLSVLHY